jgi:hypothetical protein
MKKITKMAMVAAAGLAVGSSANAAWDGDLILGFTTQSGNDVVYDLGAADPSTLTSGEQWNITSAFTAAGINSSSWSTIKWGVVGDDSSFNSPAGSTYSTFAGTAKTVPNLTTFNRIVAADSSIGGNLTGGSVTFITPSSTTQNSWNQQTIVGALSTQYHNAYENPNVTGFTTVNFYSALDNGSAAQTLGTFTFDNTGTVTFQASAVPEPATYGMLAGLGVLALSLRRKLAVAA